MKQTFLTILVALCALAGTATTARAESRTVTYTITAEYDQYNANNRTITFTPSSSGFGYSTGTKTVNIQNTASTTGFIVNLDDGLRLAYSQNEGKLTFWGSEGFYLNHSSDGATVTLYAQWRPVAGSCGDNARWSYDDNGTLSITGTGGTYDFTSGFRPWEPYKDAITTVSIGDGITNIGNSAFDQYSNLATITGGNGLIDVYPSGLPRPNHRTRPCRHAANARR